MATRGYHKAQVAAGGGLKMRPCLRCGMVIETDAGHRICGRCREANRAEADDGLTRGRVHLTGCWRPGLI